MNKRVEATRGKGTGESGCDWLGDLLIANDRARNRIKGAVQRLQTGGSGAGSGRPRTADGRAGAPTGGGLQGPGRVPGAVRPRLRRQLQPHGQSVPSVPRLPRHGHPSSPVAGLPRAQGPSLVPPRRSAHPRTSLFG